jgi:hypothetical protein
MFRAASGSLVAAASAAAEQVEDPLYVELLKIPLIRAAIRTGMAQARGAIHEESQPV